MKRVFLSFLLICIIVRYSSGQVAAPDTLVVGQTYEIAEPDALAEMKQRAASINWEKLLKEKGMEAFENYQPKNLRTLPKAARNSTRLVDMSYTLEMDVPNAQGGVLYPEGYTFNPLEYVPFTGILVVIDPTDPDQENWFIQSEYAENLHTRLLITNGKHMDVAKRLERPVFYLSMIIAQRLDLKAVPSIVMQKDKFMEVKEIDVARISSN